ncbi:MAG TPA: CIA30 family protein [Candidatus Goldiibacteriota bacterium]|nr:CIA30 family protein [Candidatus Goldiibacteriota bacterium]
MKKLLVSVILIMLAAPVFCVNVTIDVTAERAPISKHIYGANIAGDPEDPTQYQLADSVNWASRRQGGNRFTAYNWEINASNAGADYGPNSSDPYLCQAYGVTNCDIPGEVLNRFHTQCLARGQSDLVTVQMAGFAAADKIWNNGDPGTAIADLTTDRWKTVISKKPSGSFLLTPDTTDEYVYMDEYVNWMVNKFGGASSVNGVKMISLDNEPTLWATTHPRVHPTPVTFAELKDESIALAKAIKDVDPNVEIFGAADFGWSAFVNLNSAVDANTEGAAYTGVLKFTEYYLDKFEAASAAYGRRLLDVIDVHWYPEDNGNLCRIVYTDYDNDCPNKTDYSINADARMQAPRCLWDSTYNEDSWIPSPINLIGKLQTAVNTYYPGTKISISEYDFGGGTHYSAGIAQADALGVFGKYGVYAAYYWDITPGPYTLAGVKLYRNYDGAKSTYGDTKVKANTDDVASMPVYASQFSGDDSKLHIIVINRSGSAKPANISINGPYMFDSGSVWGFDSTSYTLTARAAVATITGNAFTYNVPAYTALHMVLDSSMITPTFTETINPLFTHTYTPTPTATPEPGVILDDFEDNNTVNKLGGPWYKYSAATSDNFAFRLETPGNVSAAYCAHVTGTVNTGDYGGFGTNLDAGADVPVDLSAYQGIEFYIKGNSTSTWMQFTQPSITDYDYFGKVINVTTTWTKVTVLFSEMLPRSGSVSVPLTVNEIVAIQWANNGEGAFDVQIDDIKLLPAAVSTPTHTATNSATHTFTATYTNTSTRTNTYTSTNTATVPTNTNTHTATFTFTDTATETFTVPANTNTYTVTYTQTSTHTDTFTQTQTVTDTYTNTFTDTATATHTFTSTETPSSSCPLIFSDEFDGASIDGAKWVFETGSGGWGNNEIQYYTDRADNARIEGGNLVIEARQESYGGSAYTSARMKTQGRFSAMYGRVEAKIKLPYGQGIWPAFWMLGDNIGTVGWPACGEIDIMEMIGGGEDRDDTLYGTAHWEYNGHASYGGHTELPDPQYFYEQYHVFAIEWDSNSIRWYLDGVQYHVIDITPADLSELNQDYFIILNLAVGGNWPGSPDGTTVFPQRMYVDWVRWYNCDAPTYTPTATVPTNTFTNTPTDTYTATSTNTGTNTQTQTYTNTATETPTDTETITVNTNTYTQTYTHTYTFTETHTATETQTVPPGSTDTHTFTATETGTNTFTFTETYTHTYTDTETHTATETQTSPPVSTDTPTFTETQTAENTNTHTATYTHTFTNTNTHTPTNSNTVPVNTSTYTHTRTYTNTATDTHTATQTYTQIPSNTATHTFTHTATLIPVFTVTPTATEGEKMDIKDLIAYPNPLNPVKNGLWIKFTAAKSGKNTVLRVYSSGFRCVKEAKLGVITAGENRYYLAGKNFQGLANGTYYYVAETEVINEKYRSKVNKLIILK